VQVKPPLKRFAILLLVVNPCNWKLSCFGTRQLLTVKRLKLTTSAVEFDVKANDLGVVLNSHAAVDGLTYSSNLPILLLPDASAEVHQTFTGSDVMHALVQAFVNCKLDYCNSLLTDAANVRFKRLQSVQNVAARSVSGARRRDHITPVFTTLHWLPVHKRVMFKTVMLMWKCLNGTAPSYLSELCVPVASASGRTCTSASPVSLDGPTTSSQNSKHDRPAELRCRATVSMEQSSCCSTKTRDVNMYF